MIIKVKQTVAIGEGAKTKLGIPISSGSHSAQYECIYQNFPYGEFTYTEKSMITSMTSNASLFKVNDFTGEFNGTGKYEIRLENVISPAGFTKDGILYEKQIDEFQKCIFSPKEHAYYENGVNVGRLREYLIQKNEVVLGKIPMAKLDYYDAINWKGKNYYLFPLKARGIYYLCVYEEETLIATIEMGIRSAGRNEYTIYAFDNTDADFLCMMAVKFDYTYFKSTLNSKLTPPAFEKGQQRFASKFDPNFIPNLLAKYQ